MIAATDWLSVRIQPVDATLLLLTQILVCCIDRLNPQAKAVIRLFQKKRQPCVRKLPLSV